MNEINLNPQIQAETKKLNKQYKKFYRSNNFAILFGAVVLTGIVHVLVRVVTKNDTLNI